MNFKSIIKKHTLGVSLLVFFIFLENFTWILEPTFFGKLLDALIDKFYNDDLKTDYIFPLSLWIGIYLLNTLGGALSRLYSGKIYSKIYVDIAGEVISSSTIKGLPSSRILARAELAKEYATALKDRLPEVIWLVFATFGAIFALFFYDWRIAAICFGVIFPIAFIYSGYRKNVVELQKDLHDKREDLYALFEDQNTEAIRDYYHRSDYASNQDFKMEFVIIHWFADSLAGAGWIGTFLGEFGLMCCSLLRLFILNCHASAW